MDDITADQSSYFDDASIDLRDDGAAAMTLFLLARGACIESYTDVCGGVSARRPFMLAVGVAERLGYTVLVRESGRGGDDTLAAAAAAIFFFGSRGITGRAKRASSAATWSRSLFSRS